MRAHRGGMSNPYATWSRPAPRGAGWGLSAAANTAGPEAPTAQTIPDDDLSLQKGRPQLARGASSNGA